MRELRSCDFCGGDAAGTFEIVPPELEPTEAEQRRVVLCPDCKERLETLVEPLLARAGAGDATTGAGAATDDRPAVESASTRAQSSASSPTGTGGSDGDDGDAARDGAPETDSGPATDRDEPTGDAVESGLEDGITFERSGAGSDDGDETPGGDAATDVATATETATSDGDEESDSAAEPGPASSGAATRPPSAYGKVVRLLRNREFPMKRDAVEELAAGAYDLEPDEVDEIVDYAIERGEFVEKRGKLTRP